MSKSHIFTSGSDAAARGRPILQSIRLEKLDKMFKNQIEKTILLLRQMRKQKNQKQRIRLHFPLRESARLWSWESGNLKNRTKDHNQNR